MEYLLGILIGDSFKQLTGFIKLMYVFLSYVIMTCVLMVIFHKFEWEEIVFDKGFLASIIFAICASVTGIYMKFFEDDSLARLIGGIVGATVTILCVGVTLSIFSTY